MRPENVVVETADGLSSNTKYIVTMWIILTGNGNENICKDHLGRALHHEIDMVDLVEERTISIHPITSCCGRQKIDGTFANQDI